MSSNATLRKLQRFSGAGMVQGGMSLPGMPMSPRQCVEDQQDRDRTYLAAELLKIRAETATRGELAACAREALAAAEIIFPELPEDGGAA